MAPVNRASDNHTVFMHGSVFPKAATWIYRQLAVADPILLVRVTYGSVCPLRAIAKAVDFPLIQAAAVGGWVSSFVSPE